MVLALDYVVFNKGFKKNLYGIVIKPFDMPQIVYFDGNKVQMISLKECIIVKKYRHWIYTAKRNAFETQAKIFSLYKSNIDKKFLKVLNSKASANRVFMYLIASYDLEYPEAYNKSRLEENELFDTYKGFSEVGI